MKKIRYLLISIILLLVITNPKKEKHNDLIISCYVMRTDLTTAKRFASAYRYSNYFIFSTYKSSILNKSEIFPKSFGILGNTWNVGGENFGKD